MHARRALIPRLIPGANPRQIPQLLPRLLAILVLASAGPLHGTVYYVDRENPAASDANPGSETLPWLTIQHAAVSLAAGDTVWVKNGAYPEQVTIALAGAPGQEIRFAAYPGHTVTLDGSGLAIGEYQGLLQLAGASYVRVSGFHVAHSGPAATAVGIQVDPGQHVVIEGNHTSDTASSGILVWGSSDVLIADNEVEQAMALGAASRNERITVGRTTGFEVRGNHVHDGSPARGEGICLKDGSSLGSAHHNHVHHVPAVGIYVDAWTEPTHDLDVWANRVHDVDGSGIQIASEQGGLLERVRVFDNLSYANRWTGLTVSSCCISVHPMADVRVVNNSFWGNGWSGWGGGIGNESDQVTGLLIRNNAVAGNLSFEISFEGIDPTPSTLDHNLIGAWHGYPGEICGADCQVGDPLWAAPAAGDFHLAAGSPAIDHGSPLAAPLFDFDGNTRPQGPGFDIGALERLVALFADGFESGDTSAWSATVP